MEYLRFYALMAIYTNNLGYVELETLKRVASDISNSKLHRLINALLNEGLIERAQWGQYRLCETPMTEAIALIVSSRESE